MTTLVYVGDGFLPGVPARNLTDDEVTAYGGAEVLLASGLYEEEQESVLPAATAAKPVKAGKTEVSDGRS